MFCNMCGKKVDEKSAFCTWCGAPIDRSAGTTGTAAEAPAEPQEQPQPVFTAAAEPTFSNTHSAAYPGAAPDGNSFPQENADKAAETGAPADIPISAGQPAGAPEPAKSVWGAEVPLSDAPQQEKPVKPEKYYTSGQLALCLVTTGIMALAAGIFAALYFIQIL